MIYRRELEPGERIVERKLSRKLGVSRVPLRESLLRLESEGLIKRVPYGPSHVTDFTDNDIMEMYSMRLLIEPFATGLAASHQPPSLVRKLKGLCKQMTRAAKAEKWTDSDDADCEFHRAIVKASGHKALIDAYAAGHIHISRFGNAAKHPAAGMPANTTAKNHDAIIAALEKRDVVLAQSAAYAHVKASINTLIQERFGSLTTNQKRLFELPATRR